MIPSSAPPPHPFFMGGGAAARFCLYHAPAGECRGSWLYVHPFAEEMNKSRRMAALQARLLADHGFAVLQLDLYGCGDSAGDFGDARWSIWQEDLDRGAHWLRRNADSAPGLWGLRLGALLAATHPSCRPAALLLWQPVLTGAQHLQQFLRLKVAGQALAAPLDQRNSAALRRELLEGSALEVAGYSLAPELAAAMEQANLASRVPQCRVHWFECSELTPASSRAIEQWRGAGANIHTHAVESQPFWATQEITESQALLRATLDACLSPHHA
ncbi:hydrolase 2, exosortase A system-associated [Massilia endophytica]|uniref:hydrolase 2, exosortase A system-associated n=1 Tax=Massilia endophytica TaxID=2899220 RepID=UPI001E4D7C29|nr:hydrolase 2, exosortase A system-associated [Massilia endophytica]UGQ46224.1 hydrolase 2, exosortase A system-associated [Massilia endophytica]